MNVKPEEIRMRFILQKYNLHKKECHGVHNFDEMCDELSMLLFQPLKSDDNYVERV